MNYINIKEAVNATGKSEKTIRRFLTRVESTLYINKKDNKLLVDVNYLFASYQPIKNTQNEIGQKLDIDQKTSVDIELTQLKNVSSG